MTPRPPRSPQVPSKPVAERRTNRPLREVLNELLEHTRGITRRARQLSSEELEYAQQRLEWLADEVWRIATGGEPPPP